MKGKMEGAILSGDITVECRDGETPVPDHGFRRVRQGRGRLRRGAP